MALLGHVASHGEVQVVAERMGMTRQGVRRQLGRVEHFHGGPVVRYAGTRVRLTELGHRLLVASRAFYVRLDCALSTAAGGDDRDQSIGVATSVHVDGEVLHEIAQSALPVLRTTSHEPAGCVRAFEDYEVEAMLLWTTCDEELGLRRDHVVTTVLDDPLWAVAPVDHPALGEGALSLSDVVGERWTSTVGHTGQPVVEAAFDRAGLSRPAAMDVCESSQVAHCLGLRTRSLALRPQSSIPGALWPAARPLEGVTLGRIVLVTDRVVTEGAREGLAMVLRRRLLCEQLGRLAGGRWSAELGAWHRRQAERLREPTTPSCACASPRHPGVRQYPLDRGDIEILHAVMHHGSINRAASALSLSQPALTRRLQRLEAEVGVQLLFRDPRGVQPTEFLKRLLAGVDHAARGFLTRFATAPTPESGARGSGRAEWCHRARAARGRAGVTVETSAPPAGWGGFLVHTGAAGVVDDGRDDFCVILGPEGTTSAAAFTRSRTAGPCVEISRSASRGALRGVVVLARNANVATGPQGYDDALEVRQAVADRAGSAGRAAGHLLHRRHRAALSDGVRPDPPRPAAVATRRRPASGLAGHPHHRHPPQAARGAPRRLHGRGARQGRGHAGARHGDDVVLRAHRRAGACRPASRSCGPASSSAPTTRCPSTRTPRRATRPCCSRAGPPARSTSASWSRRCSRCAPTSSATSRPTVRGRAP